ncbi:MAG: class I SAM-dependent methyltransferase [Phycisphaeraceae bacterium]|nr:class I SAM-dependent methyltransferase [Phycisphaerae bacterium]MBX3391299.1 class I SAM-dependent methyltransferase [Phycisphaeraceae bacterium]
MIRRIQPDVAETLREALARRGYDHAGLKRVLGIGAGGFVDISSGPLLMRRTADGLPLSTMVRLFIGGASVEAGAAERALDPVGLGEAARAGLIESDPLDPSLVRATVALVPYEDLVLAADFSRRTSGEIAREFDHVMGVGRSSAALGKLARGAAKGRRGGGGSVRDGSAGAACGGAGRVLDLGCGCGYLALRMAGAFESAIGTDVNERAVGMSVFNARLNGLPNATFRLGSMTDPVAGESFDLVVTNPPFVISPETGQVYRDGARRPEAGGARGHGDEFCSWIARHAPGVLRDDGVLVMLVNWSHGEGDDGSGRLSSWAPPGMQAWVLRTDTQRVDEYASMWIRHTESGTPGWSEAMFADRFDRWMKHYGSLGIERISYGAMVVRRARPAFFEFDSMETAWIDSGAVDVARGLDGRAAVAAVEADHRDEGVLAGRWRVAPDVRVLQRMAPRDGAWRAVEATVTIGGTDDATGRSGRPVCGGDPAAVESVLRVDGKRALVQVVDETASMTGRERSSLRAQAARIARALAREGGLTPV